MSAEPFNSVEMSILRCLYIIVLTMFTFTLAFAIFNIVKYIYPMTERSGLVCAFYILVIILCSSNIILGFYISIDPNQDPYIYDTQKFQGYEFSELVSACSMLALGWLVTVTMFQLTITIRVIFKMITLKSAKILKVAIYIYAATFSSLQLLMIILIPYVVEEFDNRSVVVSYVFIGSYITITVSYSAIIIFMRITLNYMKNFGGDYS